MSFNRRYWAFILIGATDAVSADGRAVLVIKGTTVNRRGLQAGARGARLSLRSSLLLILHAASVMCVEPNAPQALV